MSKNLLITLLVAAVALAIAWQARSIAELRKQIAQIQSEASGPFAVSGPAQDSVATEAPARPTSFSKAQPAPTPAGGLGDRVTKLEDADRKSVV